MSDPLISLLVPIYNVENYIDRCSRSLFEQTYTNLEFIFVNDCSPDSSIQILLNTIRDYPDLRNRIKIIDHKVNQGLSAARNTGIDYSRGEYIMHIDSDDFVDVTIVDKLYRSCLSNNADISICNVRFMYMDRSVTRHDVVPPYKIDYINSILSRRVMFNMFAKLIKRDLIVDNNIRSLINIGQGEDFVVYPRIVFYANTISVVEETLYYYNQTNVNSYTKTMDSKGITSIYDSGTFLYEFFSLELSDLDKVSILNNLQFFNLCTILKVAPLNKYSFFVSLYPDIRFDSAWPYFNKLIYFLIKIKFHYFTYSLYTLIRWLKN